MFFRQIIDPLLSQYAYLIGCETAKEAILFEPERDIERYFKLAEKNGYKIVGAADTHIHADYLSGLREIAERGVKVYASDEGTDDWKYEWLKGSSYNYQLLKDGDELKVGSITFNAIHTPGHTPEHISFMVTEKKYDVELNHGLMTGDFVFVGDVGRPDLLETAAGYENTMKNEAAVLYDSLQNFKKLPGDLMVWPTHGAGSACGKSLGASPMSTVEEELKYNPSLLAADDKQKFLEYILTGQPEPPYYFARMKIENKKGPAILKSLPVPKKVSAKEIEKMTRNKNAVVLDGRSWEEFHRGYLKNSLHAPMNSNFIMVTGSYIDAGTEIGLITDEDILEQTVVALNRIGLDNITSYATPQEVVDSGLATETIEEIKVSEFKDIVENNSGNILDVRRIAELEQTGRIGDAQCVAYTRLKFELDDIPSDGKLYVYCRTGNRSAYASSYLKNCGYDIIHVEGGIVAWQGAGFEVTPFE